MDWRDKAACLTADPELFFPVGNTGPAVDQIEKAKTVCASCSVTEQRAQTAFAFSIWSTAGPVLPTGKKSSGSAVRQALLSRQSMLVLLVLQRE